MDNREHCLPGTRKQINLTLADPTVSFWLKDALRAALSRDCMDAAADADELSRLLDRIRRDVMSPVR